MALARVRPLIYNKSLQAGKAASYPNSYFVPLANQSVRYEKKKAFYHGALCANYLKHLELETSAKVPAPVILRERSDRRIS
jgi:hypothetical protein